MPRSLELLCNTGEKITRSVTDYINSNAGCGITEWSRASYGPLFDQQGGGVFAMKWDEVGISVWSFFRAAVPQDIVANAPNLSIWGKPSALLEPEGLYYIRRS
ncbi:hypothetical protein MPER_15111 [Moniliophthora perniciosa FA553]|nr:hypothetical protein MPER_15111 [Moniliophthora perniciosa FA553]